MKLPVSGGGNFEQCPIGTHAARCIKLIDIGTQKNEYQGEINFKRQFIVSWELPNELMTTGEWAGKPFSVSKFYTFSMHEQSTFRKDLQNWRGQQFNDEQAKEFDVKTILDKGCMLSVVHTDKGRAKVTSVMGLPKGMTLPERVNPLVYFSLDEFDQTTFDNLSDGFKAMVEKSPEHKMIMESPEKPKKLPSEQDGDPGFNDDIPF